MTLLHSLILGLVEGLTEFIPVSSTFHLIATARLLSLPSSDFLKLFEVVIQSGAILSITWLYGQKILRSPVVIRHLLTSFLPTAVVGAILYKLIKGVFFESTALQLFVFVLVGVLFLLLEHLLSRSSSTPRPLSALTPKHALFIGLAQALSVIPGVSRSGSILLIMLFLGYDRRVSADYAFMLSLPTIAAATALDLLQNAALFTQLTSADFLNLGVGVLAAFLSALWVMRWLLKYLSTNSLRLFGYYRLVSAVFLSQLL